MPSAACLGRPQVTVWVDHEVTVQADPFQRLVGRPAQRSPWPVGRRVPSTGDREKVVSSVEGQCSAHSPAVRCGFRGSASSAPTAGPTVPSVGGSVGRWQLEPRAVSAGVESMGPFHWGWLKRSARC